LCIPFLNCVVMVPSVCCVQLLQKVMDTRRSPNVKVELSSYGRCDMLFYALRDITPGEELLMTDNKSRTDARSNSSAFDDLDVFM